MSPLNFLFHILVLLSLGSSISSAFDSSVSNQHALESSSTQEQPQPVSKNLSDIVAASPLLSLHHALCEVESITNNEHAVGELLAAYLEAHNFTVTTQQVAQPDPGRKPRYNIFARPKSLPEEVGDGDDDDDDDDDDGDDDRGSRKSGQGPVRVLLTSHIDTVPPFLPYRLSAPASSRSGSPLSTSHNDQRSSIYISGRGTVDAKACVATQIHAVLSLLHSQSPSTTTIPPSSLALLFVVGEEGLGDGMAHFSRSPLYRSHLTNNLTAIIFGEPTELNLASGHKGIMRVDLAAHGKAAHSGYPWLGRSANSMLLPALVALDRLGGLAPDQGGLAGSEKYGNSTVNVGLVRGGVAANVVAERAEASVLVRLGGGTVGDARGVVERAVKGSTEEGEGLEVEFSQGYGPVGLDADVDGFGVITVNYGTDVPNLEVGEGVKRYLYGPGSILVAHSDHEGLTVGDLEEAVEGYKKLVLHALGK